MTTELTKLSLADTAKGLKNKDFTSKEVTASYLYAIEKATALNAFVAVTADQALDMAAQSDARLAKGEGRRAGRRAPWR